MSVPFSKDLDKLFRSSTSIWLKIGAGGLVGFLLSAGAIFGKEGAGFSSSMKTGIAITVTLLGMLLGLALSLKDLVAKRKSEGSQVPFLLNLLFGMGVISLIVWIIAAITLTIFFLWLSIMAGV
jgi:hypothetical protein